MTENPPGKIRHKKLRASQNFVQALTLSGRPYIAKETEPYSQYWLTERERVLFFLYSNRCGLSLGAALAAYYRLTGKVKTEGEDQLLLLAIQSMREHSVLVEMETDTSRYSAAIVDDYLGQRPFPKTLAKHMVNLAGMHADSRVLDLAGGPGDLALQLASVADHVTLMELSRGFIQAAARNAKQLGVKLQTLHESCNRLIYHDGEYDVITISQALHWLDDVQVCRGVCRILSSGGSFFVIHSIMEVADEHPLAYLLGYDSILGKKQRIGFAAEVQPLFKRLSLLFAALDAPEVQRMDPAQRWETDVDAYSKIVPVGVTLYRQRRPFDMGFTKGFLTPAHIQLTGQSEQIFWQDMEARCLDAGSEQMLGYHHWAVMHFKRGGEAFAPDSMLGLTVQELEFP